MSSKTVIKTVSKVYKNVNAEKGPNYFNYNKLNVVWNIPDKYKIVRKVGRGKYSEVFEGYNTESDKSVIIKVLKPVRGKKVLREIQILRNLRDGDNIIKLLDIVKDRESTISSFIFENIDGVDLKSASAYFTEMDIRYYLYELLKALDYCHSMGIIHRDVKPRNIMVNPEKKVLKLIDWGLAEFYHPGEEYNVRVATRNYKGPELLVDMRYYHYSLDIWSVGCVLAGIMFKKDPFFRGADNLDQLVKVVKVLGSKGLEQYVNKYKIYRMPEIKHLTSKSLPKKSWNTFINSSNQHLVTQEALNLLDKLLQYDHQTRPTAAEAMLDPYFDSIRAQEKSMAGENNK